MIDLLSFYSNKAAQFSNDINKVTKHLLWIGTARLILFVLLIVFFYYFLVTGYSNYLIGSAICLIIFLALVKKSSTLTYQKNLLTNLHFINENESSILRGERNKFDNGVSVLADNSYYADLDVFGERSLFHLINRTVTTEGYSGLVSLLRQPFNTVQQITNFQKAIEGFAKQTDIREKIIAQGLLNKDAEGSIDEIIEWIKEPPVLINKRWVTIIRYLFPVLSLVIIFIALNLTTFYPVTIVAIAGWIIVGFFSKHTQRQHMSIGRKQQLLNQYSDILTVFEGANAGDSEVLILNKKLATEAHKEIGKLAKLANLLDQRLNLLVNILLNSFAIYDIQCVLALERWKLKNKEQLGQWISCVASIDVLTSLSAFAFNHPSYCYPSMVTNEIIIEATEIGHPLIKPTENVTNNLSLGKNSKLLLITGSNMSGKTTFLRTIGINILLAKCGAPVCAKKLSFTPVDIYTSIRISDSLQENTSYFMAELKRLSEIKNLVSKGQPSLVLIDEILRGTNSEDKFYGSAEFVKKLIQYNCLTLFATHDLKLSELENEYPGAIENHCFESIIENDDLKFDYRFLRGVAQNKNASFLMKKMDII